MITYVGLQMPCRHLTDEETEVWCTLMRACYIARFQVGIETVSWAAVRTKIAAVFSIFLNEVSKSYNLVSEIQLSLSSSEQCRANEKGLRMILSSSYKQREKQLSEMIKREGPRVKEREREK